MSNQIIALGSVTQPDGSFSVNGVFWLTAPSNAVVPLPKFKSQVQNISDADALLLRQGARVEVPFTSGLFESGTTLADVQTALQALYTEAQATLDATNPPIAGLVGTVFNGTAWVAADVPTKDWINAQTPPTTLDGRLRVAQEKPDGAKVTFITHDWTDKTTWYSKSTRVVAEVASDSGDHTTYTLAHAFVVDTYHGKIFGEDFLKDASSNSYRVVVKVDGVTKVERDPHVGSGGDFVVDYAAGSITFASALDPAAVVTVTYAYASDSTFIIKPSAGKQLVIDLVEVQFSADVDFQDTVLFQLYGFVQYFAPQLCPSPYPSGTLIPLGNPIMYKTMKDFQSDAVKAYPSYSALGGASWRGMSQSVSVFDWDYLSSMKLRSDQGMEIRTSLQHHLPFGGSYGTASFYCRSETL